MVQWPHRNLPKRHGGLAYLPLMMLCWFCSFTAPHFLQMHPQPPLCCSVLLEADLGHCDTQGSYFLVGPPNGCMSSHTSPATSQKKDSILFKVSPKKDFETRTWMQVVHLGGDPKKQQQWNEEVKQGREENKQKGVPPSKLPCGQVMLNLLGAILETVRICTWKLSHLKGGELRYLSPVPICH